MIETLLQVVTLAAAVVIVARTEPALNRMNRATPFVIRLAFYLLTVGAVAQILFVLAGHVPTFASAITCAGAAVLLVCEGRLRGVLTPVGRSAQ